MSTNLVFNAKEYEYTRLPAVATQTGLLSIWITSRRAERCKLCDTSLAPGKGYRWESVYGRGWLCRSCAEQKIREDSNRYGMGYFWHNVLHRWQFALFTDGATAEEVIRQVFGGEP